MSVEIFLIAPAGASADQLNQALDRVAAATAISALLLPRGELAEPDYRALIQAVAPKAQAAGTAVLIEGDPALAKALRVDGLHVTGGIKAVKEAVAALKPGMIVGIGDSRSRHDAMQKAEAGVDYILFGPLSGPISPDEREMARWWAETMEIPSVLSDPEASLERYEPEGCEFIGLPLRLEERAE